MWKNKCKIKCCVIFCLCVLKGKEKVACEEKCSELFLQGFVVVKDYGNVLFVVVSFSFSLFLCSSFFLVCSYFRN